MKRIRYTTVLKAAGLALCFWLAACTDEQLLSEMRPLEIEAVIPAQTKASLGASALDKTAFINDDSIKVVRSGGSETASYKYDLANGRWLPKTGTGLSTTGNQTFIASWRPDGFTGILADQTTVENYQKSIQLTDTAAATNNLVQFRFAPAATKITITVTYTDGSNITGGTASMTGSKLLNETETSQTINFYAVTNSGAKHTFVGVVYPGTGKTYTISVTSTATTTTTKTYTQASKELKAGYNYTYNFTTDSRTLLILNNVTVNDFVDDNTTPPVGDAT
ncbi:fimbrillin family protein [uncultured Parabacteroides sp.]|uniref:fimbrillin family protein n=1 Tax=uncultured Parabacteroides sp. TaxID=512312 RepID=UPI0025D76F56|nr:fimbrillin family protein [uncultured Parabacteroides sp.]